METLHNESQENKVDQRLGIEEGQEEAALLRAWLKESTGHEPTAQDYDHALHAVEEIKQLAEIEPAFDKVLFRIAQIGNKYFQGATDVLFRVIMLGKRPNESDRVNSEHHYHMFDDAVADLRHLKERAEIMQRTDL